eukprot:6022633-Lingulodinium_polyedra.AAC.1
MFKAFACESSSSSSATPATSISPTHSALESVFDSFLPTDFQTRSRGPEPSMCIVPAERGGIKKACLTNAASAEASSSGFKATVMRALTGNVRSTLRVSTPSDPARRAWAEVRHVQSARHFEIVSAICTAVNRGQVTTKDQAQKLKEELLAKDAEP